jgi:hypothetical protein
VLGVFVCGQGIVLVVVAASTRYVLMLPLLK